MPGDTADPETVATLASMGFADKHVRAALKASSTFMSCAWQFVDKIMTLHNAQECEWCYCFLHYITERPSGLIGDSGQVHCRRGGSCKT